MGSLTSSRSVTYWVALLAVTVTLVLPLWSVDMLPWKDFPGHVSRVFILTHYGEVPIFQQYYELEQALRPNLAFDLTGPFLMRWMDPYVAARVYVSILAVLFAISCHLLAGEIHGRPSWLALPASFFFYNSLLLLGFVNFTTSLCLFMISAAVWVRFHHSGTWRWGLIATLCASLTYVAHLGRFVFLCLFIGLWTLVDMIEERQFRVSHVLLGLPLAPGLIAYLRMQSPGESAIVWATPLQKLRNGWVLFSGYDTWMDVSILLGLMAVGLMVWRYGQVRIGRPPLVIAGVLALAYVAFPTAMHTGSEADARFVPAAALVALLGATVQMQSRMARIAAMVYLPGYMSMDRLFGGRQQVHQNLKTDARQPQRVRTARYP